MVYVVDDDGAVRESTVLFLIAAGYLTRAFPDGLAFLAAADKLVPGCVLLDVRMPGIDGLEVLQRLNGRRAQLPVAVMTGHGDIATAVRAMQLGALDFLEKPFEEEVIVAVLDRIFAVLADNARKDRCHLEAVACIARLSEREREVLEGLLAGFANKVLAFQMGISVRTVEMHRAGMMDRLGVRTFAEALRLAFEAGIVTHDRLPAVVGGEWA